MQGTFTIFLLFTNFRKGLLNVKDSNLVKRGQGRVGVIYDSII